MTLQNASVMSPQTCSSSTDVKTNSLRWDLTPEEIRRHTELLIQRIKRAYDSVGRVDIGKVCFDNTLQVLADAKLDYAGEWRHYVLCGNRSNDLAVIHIYPLHCHFYIQLHVTRWTSLSSSPRVKR